MPSEPSEATLRKRALAIELAREEFDLWIRHTDGQDAKAGIVLGFTAALLALVGGEDPEAVVQVGRLLAALAALLAGISFWPRQFRSIDHAFWSRALAEETPGAEGELVGTYQMVTDSNRSVAREKARWLHSSLIALGLALSAFALEAVYSLRGS